MTGLILVYCFSGPPFPPKNLTQIFPEGVLATSVYLRWAEIPVAEQGGELQHYNITYWVKGQTRRINKTDLSIGRPTATGGLILFEIKGLQTGVEYVVEVYGVNRYLTDDIEQKYYNQKYFFSEITATPELRMSFFILFIC